LVEAFRTLLISPDADTLALLAGPGIALDSPSPGRTSNANEGLLVEGVPISI
jgi:hypothetical protein